MTLENRVAVITGATGGLGGGLSRMFADAGARLVVSGRSKDDVSQLVDELGPAKTLGLVADVTDPAQAEDLVAQTQARFGRLDMLINLVGAYRAGRPVAETSLADWDFMLNVNLRSVFVMCRAVVPIMAAAGWGRIINVGSRSPLEIKPNSAAYTIAKGGVLLFTQVLAAEVKAHGVTVNAVVPGTIDTPDNRRAMPDADFSHWVRPEHIAETMLFLCSDAAADISGQSLGVFGRS